MRLSQKCAAGLTYTPAFTYKYTPTMRMWLRIVQVIARRPNVCKQLHMPAQSGSSGMLARMKRGYTRGAYDALVARIRERIPGVALSTDIITGTVSCPPRGAVGHRACRDHCGVVRAISGVHSVWVLFLEIWMHLRCQGMRRPKGFMVQRNCRLLELRHEGQ